MTIHIRLIGNVRVLSVENVEFEHLLFSGVGKGFMGKGNGGGGGVMDLVNMGVNAMAGGGGKGGGGGGKSPMMDLVNMGINAMAGSGNQGM